MLAFRAFADKGPAIQVTLVLVVFWRVLEDHFNAFIQAHAQQQLRFVVKNISSHRLVIVNAFY
jgi:hypothetical protein